MRCAGPMRLTTMPMAAACIPAFPNLSRLALGHVDLAGFVAPTDTILELCWRLGLRDFIRSGIDEPPLYHSHSAWEIFDADSEQIRVKCEAFLSQRAGMPPRIVTAETHIGDFISMEWYICHFFQILSSPESFHDLRDTIDAHRRYVEQYGGPERVRQLIACQSPSQDYVFAAQ
ncbi:hypothetical protein BOTBODRAFT_189452 [Botryobasidium botryosum FD-172 SS1]|uniref:Uncharacterized protein n=1 Tax=Botryobasidium botryosum (strain FD-172 SS1) TaxID=930990 RepID=A0A067MKU6_BOTB1|nr:hypothetical protein BOTBODRAFT_189452 [Botryobasidium botryosum FD-172 SS1]